MMNPAGKTILENILESITMINTTVREDETNSYTEKEVQRVGGPDLLRPQGPCGTGGDAGPVPRPCGGRRARRLKAGSHGGRALLGGLGRGLRRESVKPGSSSPPHFPGRRGNLI